MPAIPNPSFLATSATYVDVIKSVLLAYAAGILLNEEPIVSPSAGYLAYNKRMAYARQCSLNADAEAKRAAVYVAMVQPDVAVNDQATYRYFISENPSGANVFACAFSAGAGGFTAANVGLQIFDILAGVSKADLA